MFQYNAADKSKLLLRFQWTKNLATLLPQHNSKFKNRLGRRNGSTSDAVVAALNRWNKGIAGQLMFSLNLGEESKASPGRQYNNMHGTAAKHDSRSTFVIFHFMAVGA